MRRPLTAALVALGLVPLLAVDACDEPTRACTLIGCQTTYAVTLSPDGALPGGRYEVRVEADGEAQSCAFTAAAACPDGDCLSGASASCRDLYPTGRGGDVRLTFLPVRGEVDVTVLRDGVAVASAVYVAAYEPVYANGPDCGVTCERAAVEVAVP